MRAERYWEGHRRRPDPFRTRHRHDDAYEIEQVVPCGVSGADMRLPTFPCGALHGTFEQTADILIARCGARPWKLIVWEPLQTKAPGPHLTQPYCCYSHHVIFYARPYYSAPHCFPLIFKTQHGWRANAPRDARGLYYFDRLDYRSHWDAAFQFEGETWRMGGGRVVWARRADGIGKQWWLRSEARRAEARRAT